MKSKIFSPRLLHQLGAILSLLSLFLNTLLPLVYISPAFAQDTTPTTEPTVETSPTVEPTAEPTIEPTAEPQPTVDPPLVETLEPTVEPTVEVTPTIEITPTLTVLDVVTDTVTPEPTKANSAPTVAPFATDNLTPTDTPIPTSSEPVESTIPQLNESLSIKVEQVEPSTNIVNSILNTLFPSLFTDKSDYTPTEKAVISGENFNPNTTYTIIISSTDDPAVTHTDTFTTGADGKFTYEYQLDGNYRPNYKVEIKSGDTIVVTTTFTDSVTLAPATNGTMINSSTAGGTYTSISGPMLTEQNNRDIGVGTIILNAPTGFEFDPSAIVTMHVDNRPGSNGTNLTLSSGTAVVSTSTIAITVTAADQNGSTKSILWWSGIKVRPTAVSPLASGNITNSGTAIIGGVSVSTNFGTLTEVDNTHPTAAITYSAIPSVVKPGDTLYITATFSEPMANSPIPEIAISGANTVAASDMIKNSTTSYYYSYTVGAGDGTATVTLGEGRDLAGLTVVAAPTSGATFIVDSSAPTCPEPTITKGTLPGAQYIVGSTIYYTTMLGEGSFTVHENATDIADIPKVNFPHTVSLGGDVTSSPYQKTYTFKSSPGESTYDGTAIITCQDSVGNAATSTFTVHKDNISPVINSITLDKYFVKDGDTVTITSNITETGSGIASCHAYWSDDTALGSDTDLGDLGTDCSGSVTVPSGTGTHYILIGSPLGLGDNVGLFQPSNVASPAIVFDNTTPSTSDDGGFGTAGEVSLTSKTVTLTPNDHGGSGIADTKYCIVDSTDIPLSCIPNISGTSVVISCPGVASCQKIIFYSSTDNAGNVEPIGTHSHYINIINDLTPPTTTDSGIDGNWHNSNVTITLACNDTGGSTCANTYYTTDGTDPNTSSSVGNSFTLSVDGEYTIKYFSTDNAGNSEFIKTASNQVKIDKSNPTGSITNPHSGDIIRGTVTIDATAIDASGSGVTKVEFYHSSPTPTYIGQDLTAPYSITWDTKGVSDGSHSIFIKVFDNAGNQSSYISIPVTVDNTAPVSTATAGSYTFGNWNNQNVDVNLTCTDGGSGCKNTYWCYDNGSTTCQPGVSGLNFQTNMNSFSFNAEGVWYLRYQSDDNSGSLEGVETKVIKIDKTEPSSNLVVSVGTTGLNGWYISDVTVATGCFDSVSSPMFIYSSDQYQTANTTGQVFNGYCTNSAGLTTNAAPLTIKLDKTAPTAEITAPQNNETLRGTYNIAASATDDVSGIERMEFYHENLPTLICSDNNPSNGFSCNWDSTSVVDGVHQLYVIAYDKAGNQVESIHLNVAVDNTAPTVLNVTSPKNNGIYTVGEVIPVTIQFSEPVNVISPDPSCHIWTPGDGCIDWTYSYPYLTLETGTIDRNINYEGGSGTDTLTFSYTVQAGEISNDLDYVSNGSLQLNGGTMKDGAGNNANLALVTPGTTHSLGFNKNIVIDTAAPVITATFFRQGIGDSYAKVGDIVQVNFATNEYLTIDSMSIAGHAISSYQPQNPDGTHFYIVYTMTSGDTEIPLIYSLTAHDDAGNSTTITGGGVTFDKTVPVISLNGTTLDIEINHAYTELGATANDGTNGSFAATATGSVDTSAVGSYIIYYNYTDPSGNSAVEVTRTVKVVDSIANAFAIISANLSAADIANNLNLVNTNNVSNFSNLYFEKSIGGVKMGKLTFTHGLNLSDTTTQTFLQNLGSKLDQGNGRIALDARDSEIFSAIGAILVMYQMPPNISSSQLVVRDDLGTILDPIGIISAFTQDPVSQNISFNTAHFTQFDIDYTAPTTPTATPNAGDYLSAQSVSLSSSDEDSGLSAIYYTIDGSIPDSTKTLYSGPITVDRNFSLKAIAYDHAGNTSSILTAAYGIAPLISSEASSSLTQTSATISWTTNHPSTSRVIYDTVSHSSIGVAPNYGYAYSTVEDSTKVTSHSVMINDLSAGTTYYYRVISHGSPEALSDEMSLTTSASSNNSNNSSGNSSNNSNNPPVCNDTKPGSAPRLISAVAGTNSVTLTWSVASDPTSYYLVTYGDKAGAQQYGNPNVGPAGTTSYTVSSLSGDTRYYFRVRAGNGCMPGDFSNELSAVPQGQFMTVPATGFEAGVLGEQTTESTAISPTPTETTVGNILGSEKSTQKGFDWRWLWFLLIIPAGFILTSSRRRSN